MQLTPKQQLLLKIITARPDEWIRPYRFSLRASVGAALFRKGLVDRKYEAAPYHWSMYRLKKAP